MPPNIGNLLASPVTCCPKSLIRLPPDSSSLPRPPNVWIVLPIPLNSPNEYLSNAFAVFLTRSESFFCALVASFLASVPSAVALLSALDIVTPLVLTSFAIFSVAEPPPLEPFSISATRRWRVASLAALLVTPSIPPPLYVTSAIY